MTNPLLINDNPVPTTELVVNNYYVQLFTLQEGHPRQWGSVFFELNREPTPKEVSSMLEDFEDDSHKAVFMKLLHCDADSMSWFDYASEKNTIIEFNKNDVVAVHTPH